MTYTTSKYGVFFVDILGISALTNAQFRLSNFPYSIYRIQKTKIDVNKSHHYVAASLLSSFRDIISGLTAKYHNVVFSQLSDAAFFWSTDLSELFISSCDFMHQSISQGLFCRGGLAFDDLIIEKQPNSQSLGRFIIGPAATKAVNLESSGKGCRIFTDIDFASEILNHYSSTSLIHKVITPITIPTDYSVVDEVRWYLLPELEKSLQKTSQSTDEKKHICFTALAYATYMRFSPMFKLNSLNKQGRIQLYASIESITSSLDLLLKKNDFKIEAFVEHDLYELKDFKNHRNIGYCKKHLVAIANRVNQLSPSSFENF